MKPHSLSQAFKLFHSPVDVCSLKAQPSRLPRRAKLVRPAARLSGQPWSVDHVQLCRRCVTAGAPAAAAVGRRGNTIALGANTATRHLPTHERRLCTPGAPPHPRCTLAALTGPPWPGRTRRASRSQEAGRNAANLAFRVLFAGFRFPISFSDPHSVQAREARSERWGWITSRRGQDGLSQTAVISGWASTACGISRGTLTAT